MEEKLTNKINQDIVQKDENENKTFLSFDKINQTILKDILFFANQANNLIILLTKKKELLDNSIKKIGTYAKKINESLILSIKKEDIEQYKESLSKLSKVLTESNMTLAICISQFSIIEEQKGNPDKKIPVEKQWENKPNEYLKYLLQYGKKILKAVKKNAQGEISRYEVSFKKLEYDYSIAKQIEIHYKKKLGNSNEEKNNTSNINNDSINPVHE